MYQQAMPFKNHKLFERKCSHIMGGKLFTYGFDKMTTLKHINCKNFKTEQR